MYRSRILLFPHKTYCEPMSHKVETIDYVSTIEGSLFSSLHAPECSFHVGYKWVVMNVSMTRGRF
jgi:hypothetical protein